MGNFRQKLRIAGCSELAVNSRKRSASGDKARVIKKPKRSEVNFLPDFPEGKSSNSLEVDRLALENAMKKKVVDWKQVDMLMESTFSLRRKEVVIHEPLVKDVRSRWPALFTERQIAAEFRRIVSTDLKTTFFHGLDDYLNGFLKLYRTKDIRELKTLIQSLEDDSSNQRRRAGVLLGLPYFLKEDSSKFIKICEPTDEEEVVKGMNVGLLVFTEENPANLLPKEIIDVAVVLEEVIVLDGLKDVSNAFAVLMGLLYALNITYPKEVKYTFEVLQKVLMKIGGETCSSRVHGVRNKLFTV